MNCDIRQGQAGLLIDGELSESDQPALFGHLQECADCRGFLDSMIRLRISARSDHEDLLLDADRILPEWSSPVGRSHPTRAGRRFGIFALRWRMPVPTAVGLAMILLVVGAILGARVGISGGRSGADRGGAQVVQSAVVVVCGMPAVDVVAMSPDR